jgi:class 3 adenylate cyclase/tetratricopeptide (TPR) repeat protein
MPIVNCPSCGTSNEAGRKFCGECGTRLSAACPSCGTANPPGTKFCGECGTPLTDADSGARKTPEPSVAAGPSGVVAERRLVTVLFGDLVGSTTLAEDRDPEETRNLLNRYFDTAAEVIGRYGGTVEKFIGDAVMAVWGVPVAHEDDAERAVRAALDLLDSVSTITDSGQPLQMRAAVLTGEAAATAGATGQGIVAGDLVNTAARLQGTAPPGTVFVGEATRRATSEAIAYEEVGEQALKGKATPVPAWRAVQVLGMRGGARRRGSLEAPFVGRDEELRQLKDVFHATIRERKPRLVTVIGQAGIGKSRLGWEFEKYIDGVTQTAYWHAGRSPSYGEGISFWALAEMVRERAGIAETDDPETARTKLAATTAEWLTDAEERRWVEARLAGLLGLDEMPAGQREELFAAWRTFFERIADRDPVILVFKDLHWADAGLLEFIEHLLTWSKGHAIYVLAMTRPDLLERHPGWGSGVRNATTISLEPLPDESMAELLRGLVPGLPDDAVAAIVARAEGVPLYAVETVRMLLDRGQLVASDDGYALQGPLTTLAVPETLHALVAARIDANEPEDRALLADGAVLGQSFTPAALAGTTGRSEEALQPSLDRLVRRELLIRDDDPRSPERGQCRFVQAVVREVAYETLSKPDRRAKHLAAARYFEGTGDEELAGVLATHYLEALRATTPGPEADALAAQARIALRAAADRANALHAWSVAAHHLSAAVDITSDDAERASLLLSLARAIYRLLRPDAADTALEAAALADKLGDRDTANRSRALAGQIYSHTMQGAKALAILEPAASNLTEDEPGAAAVFAELARAYMLHDRFVDSEVQAERALRAAGPNRETEFVVSVLSTRGATLPALGRKDEAIALLRGAIALADSAGHIDQALRARNNLLSTMQDEMRLADQMPVQDEGVEMARRYGMPGMLGMALHSRGEAHFAEGEWDAAKRDLEEVYEWPIADGRRALVAGSMAALAAASGDEEAARGHLEECDRFLGAVGTAPQLGAVAMNKSITHILLGQPAEALKDVVGVAGGGQDLFLQAWHTAAAEALGDERALAGAQARSEAIQDSPLARAVAHHMAAVGASIVGRWDEARVEYERAIGGFRELGYELDAAVTGLAFGAFLGARLPDARKAGEEAEAWFGQRGSSSAPDRYRAAFRGTPAPTAGKQPMESLGAASEVEAR